MIPPPCRVFIWFLAFAFGTGLAVAERPNIIVIVADDLGYRDLGAFGNTEIKTPHLDALAREGVRGTSFYVTWPACTPSRASVLTGRYPQRNGLYDMIRNDMVNYGHRYTNEDYPFSPEMTLGMDLREVTIGEVLQKAGYATAVVGKWDGGRAQRFLPTQRGFDSFYGFANTGIDYWTHERYGIPSLMRDNTDIKETGYSTDLFTREAIRFVRSQAKRPFFLYLAYNAPHSASNLEKDSYQAPPEFLALYPEEKNKKAEDRRKYMACISSMDHGIGQIMKCLKELRLDENTLIFFLSDNGGGRISDNAPLRGYKGDTWEGGVRVPLIARWPGKLPAGKATDEFLTALELFPTITKAALAKAPRNVRLDGFDMLPVLAGVRPSPRKEMFWERRSLKAARVGDLKWVYMKGRDALFDLKNDPGEKDDISLERPELLAAVKLRFDTWKKEMDASEPRGPFRNF